MEQYVITSDDSGHWYVVNVKDKAEFARRVENEEEFDDLDVTPINGHPSLVIFKNWIIE